MKVEKLDKNPLLRALIYGDSGSGKTYMMGTAMNHEDTSPLLVLNARGQPITLRHFDPKPCVLTVETMEDFNNVYSWFRNGQPTEAGSTNRSLVEQPEIKYCIRYLDRLGAEKFQTLGIDSITHVQRISRDLIAGEEDDRQIGDIPSTTDIRQWGQILGQLTRVADEFYKLPVHVVITALTRHSDVPTLGITMYYPFLWGQSSLEVPSHAEIVGRLMPIASLQVRKAAALKAAYEELWEEGNEPFNVILTKGGRNFVAKWQGPLDPPGVIVSPTIGKLVEVINSSV